jgi:ATP-dependent protease ClpP protease subunit
MMFCVLLVITQARAGPFEDGIAAYDRKEFSVAFDLWLPLAEQGHRAAQFNVGIMYEKGVGVAQDSAQAAAWYLKAAEHGDVDAAYALGVLYETGTGVAKSADEARKWYDAVLSSPGTDAGTRAVKQSARLRLPRLLGATEHIVSYDQGRYVIARSADGNCVVGLQGTITKAAISRFDDVIKQSAGMGCTNPFLLLESPGGVLFEALDLGNEVRRAGLRTITRSACASACALIFMGGAERILVGSAARIGLHQSSRGFGRDRVCDPTSYSSATRDMYDYLKSVIPEQADEVIKLIMQTPCESIEWVSGERAIKLGIATRLELPNVAVGPR